MIFVEESTAEEPWTTLAAITDWIIGLVFLAELAAMLYVAPNRWRWLMAHPLEPAVVVLTPPFMPASLQALRVIRLLRLLRLLRLVQIARRSFSVVGLRYAAVLALTTALGGGAAFAAVEEDVAVSRETPESVFHDRLIPRRGPFPGSTSTDVIHGSRCSFG